MAVALLMDVHVPQAITEQLRRRGVDLLTAIEIGWADRSDEDLLIHSTELNRVIFTQDIRFHKLAQQWITEQRPFAGLLFGHQLGGTIGQYVADLEFIAKNSDLPEWANVVERLPFK